MPSEEYSHVARKGYSDDAMKRGGAREARTAPATDSPDERDGLARGGPSVETGLFALAVVLGALLRLLLVDVRPLSTDEGSFALRAFRIMMGDFAQGLGGEPLPTYGTALALALFAGGDGAARLFSVVAGTVAVAGPYLLRRELGRRAALIAAWGFALSPVLLYASRSAGSGIPVALLSLLLWWAAAGALKGEQWRPPVVALMLAGLVACGAQGITSIVTLGAAAIISHPNPTLLAVDLRSASRTPPWKRAGALFLLALVAIGAGLGANPSGMQAVLVDVWSHWLNSFAPFSPRDGIVVLLVMYELPVLLLALAGVFLAMLRRNRVDTFLALWAMLFMLIGMAQPGAGTARLTAAMAPLYLLACRTLDASLPLASGASVSWRWLLGLASVLIPALVGFGLLNREAVLATPTPSEFVYGEAALIVAGVAVMAVAARGRIAAIWCAVAIGFVAFLLHSAVFLNYRTDSAPSELIIGPQMSPQLRQAAADASYYSSYFDARVAVDPRLRPVLAWYLRNASAVEYTSAPAEGVSLTLAPQTQAALPLGAERIPGVYSPTLEGTNLTWQGLWSWAMARDGLVRTNPRDIILRAPASVW